MKVVLVVHSLRAGGAERAMSWLANTLDSRGHNVTIVVRMPEETDFYQLGEAVTVVRFVRGADGSAGHSRSRKLTGLLSFAKNLRKEVRARRPDVVVSFIDMNNIYVLAATFGLPVPTVVSERIHPDFHELGRFAPMRPLIYRSAAALVVQSDEVARIARDRWHLSNVWVIPNAVAIEIADVPKIADRPQSVIAIGRLTAQKNHKTLISAWARIHDTINGWHLTIVGSGPNEQELLTQISALGIEDSVTVIAPRHDVAALMSASRIFVLPSIYEGFPNTLIEAMTCGCVCIATTAPGAMSEILEGGESGFLVPPNNVNELARAIRKVADDPAIQQRLSRAGAMRSLDFAPGPIGDLWEEILDSVKQQVGQ